MSKYVGNGAELNRPRTKYPFKFVHETTLRVGYWVPIYVDSYVNPFTTYNLDLESFVRGLPFSRPPMGELEMYVLAAFVPHRIVWNSFKEFMGENNTSAWTGSYIKKRPTVRTLLGTGSAGTLTGIYQYLEGGAAGTYAQWHHMTLGSYLGYPDMYSPGSDDSNRHLQAEVDVLATRAYLSVWNEFVRDQPTQAPMAFSKQDTTAIGDNVAYKAVNAPVLPINKVKDVFTGCLPQPQMGNAFPLAFGGMIPVVTGDSHLNGGSTYEPLKFANLAGLALTKGNLALTGGKLGLSDLTTEADAGSYGLATPSNLWADLNGSGTPLADFRNAVLTNQWMERRAHYGNKYYESCIAEFGGRPDNVREDLPEALGNMVIPLNIQAVTSTADTESEVLGAQGAKSETYGRGNLFTYTTQEHGTLVICVGIRQSHHVYCQRMDRQFTDFDLFEQTWPSFAGSTDVEVPVNAIGLGKYNTTYANLISDWGFRSAGSSTYVFDSRNATDTMPPLGYQQYGYQEKFPVSYASGLLNPGVFGALTDFTMADLYNRAPTLNEGFMIEQPGFVTRSFVDTDPWVPNFVAKFELSGSVVRVLPGRVVAGIDRI